VGASVTLKTVWLNLASDLTQSQSFPQLSALNIATTQPGEVRTYANGRLRLVTRAGLARAISLTLPECDRDQIAWLENNVGKLMLVRDDRGRKIWATYFTMPVDENRYNMDGNITLALNEVTHSDVVLP
jgi:hypothetical protein